MTFSHNWFVYDLAQGVLHISCAELGHSGCNFANSLSMCTKKCLLTNLRFAYLIKGGRKRNTFFTQGGQNFCTHSILCNEEKFDICWKFFSTSSSLFLINYKSKSSKMWTEDSNRAISLSTQRTGGHWLTSYKFNYRIHCKNTIDWFCHYSYQE